MSIKHAAWTHGLGLELESPSWNALRQGFYCTVRPSNESTFGWVHFAIPTPVIVDGNRLHAVTAWIRYATGTSATITNIHVYDGENRIANWDGLSLGGSLRNESRAVPNKPAVLWGTGISVGLQFSGNGPNDYAEFISAGIDFYN
jgi:hypothetical protein